MRPAIQLRDERGFTLPELLISVVILGIIVVPLVGAIVVGLKTTEEVDHRVLDAHGRNLTASYFGSDVQSATTIATTDTTGCGGAGTKLEIKRGTLDAPMTVAYVLTSSGGVDRLVRRECGASGVLGESVASGPLSAVVAAHTPATAVVPGSVTLTVTSPDASVSTYTATQRLSPTGP